MDNAPEATASDTVLTAGFTPEQSAAPVVDNGHATTNDSWYGSYSEETKSLITNRGYDKLDQNAAFEDLSKGYKNLQSKLGGNHDELFKITPDMGDDDWNAIYKAMGRPDTHEGYSYKAQETDNPELVDTFLASAHELGISDNQVSKLIPKLNEKIVEIAEGHTAQVNAKNASDLSELQKEWGGAWEQNKNLAVRAAEYFGIDEDMQRAMVSSGKSAEFLKSLNKIGSLMAEGAMVGMSPSDQKASVGAMSKTEARAKLDEMQGDPQFRAKLNSTDRKVSEQASKEMEKYYKILAS